MGSRGARRQRHAMVVRLDLELLGGLRNVGVIDFERELEYNREFVLFTLPRIGA